ncbi:MAG: HEAT repeat domain-containing protein [Planctomycetota bacterium]|nr:HEAT repeat domain-containing protein [Planctomycetota bacterium]
MLRPLLCAALLLSLAVPALAAEAPTTRTAELQRLSKLALTHQAADRPSEARKAFEQILWIDPDHALARRALGYVRQGTTWVQPARPDNAKRAVAKPSAASLWRALRLAPRAADRADAARALDAFKDGETVRRLRHAAMADRVAQVRHAAIDALGRIDRRKATHAFGDLLRSSSRETRIRAVEALGRLGEELAAAYVLYRWESVGGRSPRAYFMTAGQRSYIQDFDTEVASTSFIADPIVGVIQEGTAIDATVLSTYRSITTVERAAYVGALEKISGRKLGNDAKAWRRWFIEARREARKKNAK